MATNTMNQPTLNDQHQARALPYLRWEILVFIAIFAFAVFSRFYNLGDRVMSHDESLHTQFSYDLYIKGKFEHTPLMHGPILFHFTALSYYLFGDSDFSARIYAAVVGIMVVMSPLLFRRWLGRWGTILAMLMLLISPLIMYYSRYIREDMPAIISSILMAASILMYINGPIGQRRRAHWLYILSAAMIWNLGSKETAFIYIAVFGAFLTLFWLVRLAQYFYGIQGKIIFYNIMLAMLLAVVAALMMIVVISISLGNTPVTGDSLSERLNFLGAQFELMIRGDAVTSDFTTFLTWTGLVIVSILAVVIGPALWVYRTRKTSFILPDALAILLAVLGLWVTTNIMDIGVGLIVAVSLLLVYAALRLPGKRGYGGTILLVLGMALAVCVAVLVVEELTHVQTGAGEQISRQAEPGQADVVTDPTAFRWGPIILAWVLGAATITGLIYSANRGWWTVLRQFPEFDLMIVMGSLVLPWLTAVFIVAARGSPDDFIAIANDLPPFLRDIIPVTPSLPGQELVSVGKVYIGFLAWLPMMAVAIVAGLVWDWQRWIVCSLIFHAIFAFFFTTVFTNIQGLASGMVYSLQYWMEQQGERRGSQPQYYYMLIVMPIYEFLPIIGSVLAMVAGMVMFWRKRRAYEETPVLPEPVFFEEGGGVADAQTKDLEADYDSRPLIPPLWQGAAFAGIAAISLIAFYFMTRNLQLYDVVLPDGSLIRADNAAPSVVVFFVFMFNALAGLVWLARYLADDNNPQSVEDEYMHFANIPDKIPVPSLSPEYLSEDDIEEEPIIKPKGMRDPRWALTELPVAMFFSWWAVLNLLAYTLAGEKMPWLGTHITVPLILLAAWYFGPILDRLDVRRFLDRGWIYLFLVPLLVVSGFQVIAPYLGGRPPFQGRTRIQIEWTFNWLAAVVVSALLVFFIVRLSRRTTWRHLRHMAAVAIFAMLSVMTLRFAWLAAFVNYDEATEFLVYAHGGPGNKIVYNIMKDLSIRTTGGMDIAFAYDDGMAWPGSWYFREFTYNQTNQAYYGSNPTLQRLENVAVVVVRDDGRAEVEPLLEDRFQRFDYIRMWWPLQDYFGLTARRMNNLLDLSSGNTSASLMRRAIFDIWWSRDYTTYSRAIGRDITLTGWPVSDRLHLYVRRDIVAQVWPYGVGGGTVVNPLTTVETNVCATNWEPIPASVVFNTASAGVMRPIGLTVGPDGLVYVPEEGNHRISVFSQDGDLIRTIGQQGTRDQIGAYFERPHSVAFGPEGTMYVADTWNYQIRALNSNGTQITAWGQPVTAGLAAQQQPVDGMWGPRAVAVDSVGRVYVADTGNKRIRVYTAQGEYVMDIGSGGSGPGQLDEPAGLALHPDGRVFVADTWNRRVSVFTAGGLHLPENSFRMRGWEGQPNNRPYLALDVERNFLYVTDPDVGRIYVYDTQGNCLGSFGQYNPERPNNSQFAAIGGIAVDADGNIYVADIANGRILRFDPFDRVDSPVQDGAILPDEAGEMDEEPEPELTEETSGVEQIFMEIEATDEVAPEATGESSPGG